jgi:hypothetical protein
VFTAGFNKTAAFWPFNLKEKDEQKKREAREAFDYELDTFHLGAEKDGLPVTRADTADWHKGIEDKRGLVEGHKHAQKHISAWWRDKYDQRYQEAMKRMKTTKKSQWPPVTCYHHDHSKKEK